MEVLTVVVLQLIHQEVEEEQLLQDLQVHQQEQVLVLEEQEHQMQLQDLIKLTQVEEVVLTGQEVLEHGELVEQEVEDEVELVLLRV
ncbi:MAG: hypothetical protein EB020_12035 [Proteobacteria bacterium]|nr:hypothetical protein [Pseudomonadota bacterium]NDB21588.1 hypothetical protein [Pseudomonadota bacterium]NDE76407.1 hypothetical protein [Pseudomonadota bacterium]